MVAKTLRDTKPENFFRMPQWETDCRALANTFKANAERQGQKFDVGRFLRDCGYTSD